MNKQLLSLATALVLFATAHVATAQAPMPGLAVRQAHERARETNIHQEKAAARDDGVVTRDERHEIRPDEHQATHAIYRQKHDGQERRRAR